MARAVESYNLARPTKEPILVGFYLLILFIYLFLGSSLAYLKWGVRCSCCKFKFYHDRGKCISILSRVVLQILMGYEIVSEASNEGLSPGPRSYRGRCSGLVQHCRSREEGNTGGFLFFFLGSS